MSAWPSISIVVPSFNQADYLPETLQSIVDQNYPSLEVVIQDGGSRDGSIAIAQKFVRQFPETFKLFEEKDSGQADALNRGFARTSGEIMAFLNSDDTYFPGTLHRVATEIDKARSRYVIMGRCVFTGEGSRYVGIEHPSEYNSHFDLLAIWKRGFNTIPQPSVFWHRTVWERCGGLDVNEHHALDYDLFCRFSRHYHFHRVDTLFSAYRMHDNSKSFQRTEAEVLELAIQVSRKHWGTWLAPLRWRCAFSFWLHNRHLHEQARHHARHAEQALSERRLGAAAVAFCKTLMASPRMARDRLFYAWLTEKGVTIFQRFGVSDEGFTARYTDGWIGPHYSAPISVSNDGKSLVVTATHCPHPTHRKIKVQLFINGTVADSKKIKKAGDFSLTANVEPYRANTISVEIKTNSFFVPYDVSGVEDQRKLSLLLADIEIKSN